jgi:hypothetical protein
LALSSVVNSVIQRSRSAGAVAQSKGKQNHASQREENKKQQSKKDDRHR